MATSDKVTVLAIRYGACSPCLLSPRNSVGGDKVMRGRSCVSGCVGWCVRQALPCGHNRDNSFYPITLKLHM